MKNSRRRDGATLSQQIVELGIQSGSVSAAAITEDVMQPQRVEEKVNEQVREMFHVTTATLPTNLEPAVIDVKQEQFHTRGKLYYLGAAAAATISIILLFAIKYSKALKIREWADDTFTAVLAYGGLVIAFLLWRRAEQCIDRLKTLGMMLRNYYAHNEGLKKQDK